MRPAPNSVVQGGGQFRVPDFQHGWPALLSGCSEPLSAQCVQFRGLQVHCMPSGVASGRAGSRPVAKSTTGLSDSSCPGTGGGDTSVSLNLWNNLRVWTLIKARATFSNFSPHTDSLSRGLDALSSRRARTVLRTALWFYVRRQSRMDGVNAAIFCSSSRIASSLKWQIAALRPSTAGSLHSSEPRLCLQTAPPGPRAHIHILTRPGLRLPSDWSAVRLAVTQKSGSEN